MPVIKVEPDLVTENRFTHVDGIGVVPSGPRSAEQSPDRFQYRRDAERHSRENVRSSRASRQTSNRHGIQSSDCERDIPGNHHYTRSSAVIPRGTATSQSESNLFRQELGARLTGRDKEPFGYISQEYGSRPNNYKHVSNVKKEEDDESRLVYPDTSRSVYGDNRRRSPTKAMNGLSIVSPSRSVTSSRGLADRATRSETDSNSASSSPATPSAHPVPRPRRTHARRNPACTCPIDLLCGEKQAHQIDCRPLVPESERNWQKTNNGLLGEAEFPWDGGDDEEEVFISLGDLSQIVQLMQDAETQPRSTARVTSMRLWVYSCKRESVQEGDLAASGVVRRLEAFLAPTNADTLDKKNIPKDLREDMTALLRKWQTGDLSALPHRGLLQGARKGHWTVKPEWPFLRKANFFGHGHLVNGMTWLTRMDMLRDGAHGMPQAGIHGSVERGAYAVVMGLDFHQNTYADVDYGNIVYYIGTALSKNPGSEPSNVMDTDEQQSQWADQEPTAGTRALMKSQEKGEPVRLFRSYKASKIVPNRPDKCYRYDGLYKVVDYECLKAQQQIYRFRMERLPEDDKGQGPLRGFEKKTVDRRERQRQQQAANGRGRNFGSTRSRSGNPNRRLDDERNVRQRTRY